MKRKGIILAGGTGSRLFPITQAVSKQLLPIYDKPMVYYPLSVLMLAGVQEIAVITTPEDQHQFQKLMGDGGQWGLSLSYITQPSPDGLAQAYVLAEDFLAGAPSILVLGDNIFFGHGLTDLLHKASAQTDGATIFGYRVQNPQRYGVVTFDETWKATAIEEKPEIPASPYAVTGLYFADGTAPDRAKKLTPSKRGELEITALLESYLTDGALSVERMGRGYAWLDTGTHSSLLEAGNFVRTLQSRQDQQVGCPEEIAYEQGWISAADLKELAKQYGNTSYGQYLSRLLQ